MKVDKFVRLFQAFGQSSPSESSSSPEKSERVEAAPDSGAEAVKLAPGFGGKTEDASGSRAARVAALKEQVQNGTYRPDSTKVAEAFLKDLVAI